jgi:hypothetical protein
MTIGKGIAACICERLQTACYVRGEEMRRLQYGLLLAGLILSLAGAAKADTVSINGTYSFANNGYGIPPYGGTLNGQSQSFYCVDFSHPIQAGDTWNVTITSLTGSNFSSTFLGNQTSYLAMAWLITQIMGTTNQLQIAEDQYAIWSFTGGPNPYGTNSAITAAALAAVKAGFTGQGWEILTPTGGLGQEFLIGVPEPSPLLMLLVGLMVLALATRNRRLAGARAI